MASRIILECDVSEKLISTKIEDFVPSNLTTKSSSKKSKENKNKADKKNKYSKNTEHDSADKKEVSNQVYNRNESLIIYAINYFFVNSLYCIYYYNRLFSIIVFIISKYYNVSMSLVENRFLNLIISGNK